MTIWTKEMAKILPTENWVSVAFFWGKKDHSIWRLEGLEGEKVKSNFDRRKFGNHTPLQQFEVPEKYNLGHLTWRNWRSFRAELWTQNQISTATWLRKIKLTVGWHCTFQWKCDYMAWRRLKIGKVPVHVDREWQDMKNISPLEIR